ncbi:unnamed protein product [Toxocara canis]|uniref:ATP-dependent DNA helicase n=1 Tax=Toxocara canis TaxID=6265 RepID=A0A183U873_TOXCA|nr:unnamed protein product [Toxocara canis]
MANERNADRIEHFIDWVSFRADALLPDAPIADPGNRKVVVCCAETMVVNSRPLPAILRSLPENDNYESLLQSQTILT